MRVLVTGGAGFIGSHSVEALLASGAQVVVLDNFATGRRANLPQSGARLSIIEGDIRNPADVARAMQDATHVLHLAAQVSVQQSVDNPVDSGGHNVAGFVHVLDRARRLGIRRMVYASSAAVYGAPKVLPLTEEAAPAPMSPYGLEKLIDEQYAQLYQKLYRLEALGMRYFNVYGPRQDPASPYAGVISKFAKALGENEPLRIFGDGMQTRDFIYVTDVARINLRALQASAAGVCNVGTGHSATLNELIECLERVSGTVARRSYEAPAAGDIRKSRMSPERLMQWLGERADTSLEAGLAALLGR